MKHLVIILFLFFTSKTFGKNSFSIAPTRVVVKLDKPKTETFIVFNNGTGAIRVEAQITYFPIDSKEMEYAIPLTDNLQDNLSEYVKISPRIISLNKGEQRAVRISIRPPAEIAEGEHRAHILFKMLEISEVQQQEVENKTGKKLGVKIAFNLEMAAGIIGQLGDPQYKIEVNCITKNNKKSLEIINHSKWRFEGKLKLFLDSKESNYKNNILLLRESKKSIDLSGFAEKEFKKVTAQFDQNEPFAIRTITSECSF